MGNCYGAPVKNHTPVASRNKSKQNGFAAAGTSVKGLRTKTAAAAAAAPSESESKSKSENMKTRSVVNGNNNMELKEFSLADLKKCTRDFRPDTILGEGGFGRVFKGWVDHETFAPTKFGIGMAVAVKKSASDSFQGHQEWQAEVTFLGKYRHPNLVRLLGYCCEENQYLLVYEYMQKGSLENHLFRKGQEPLPWEIRLKIAIGAARGLAFLHTSEKVIYRDFKASNILLDPSYNAKLSDFGLAKLGPINGNSHVTTRIIGTYGYAAPEYVATGHLYVKSDVYGFGVVLLEMLTGLRALDTNRPSREHSLVDWLKPCLHKKKEVKKIMDRGLGDEYPLKAACEAADLILKCLEPDPKSRPPMEEVVLILEKVNATKEKLPKTNNPKPNYCASPPSSSSAQHYHKNNLSSNKSPNRQRHGPAAGV